MIDFYNRIYDQFILVKNPEYFRSNRKQSTSKNKYEDIIDKISIVFFFCVDKMP